LMRGLPEARHHSDGPSGLRRLLAVAAFAAAFVLPGPGVSAAPPPPVPYGGADSGGFHDVLPPGTNGLVNGLQLLAYEANGARPPHNDDQLGMYRDLMYASPGLRASQLSHYFK